MGWPAQTQYFINVISQCLLLCPYGKQKEVWLDVLAPEEKLSEDDLYAKRLAERLKVSEIWPNPLSTKAHHRGQKPKEPKVRRLSDFSDSNSTQMFSL